jgi:hypothetical protein
MTGMDLRWGARLGKSDRGTKGTEMIGRGDWQNFEPSPEAVFPFVMPFAQPFEPHLLVAGRLARIPA